MTEFLKIFGDVTLADIIIGTLAILFLWDKLKQGYNCAINFHEREEEDRELKTRMKDMEELLLNLASMDMAMAKIRIKKECEKCIAKGYITAQELEDLHGLYDPYQRMGGNGTATKLMADVEKLPIK